MGTPAWKRAIDRLEETATPILDSVVRHEGVAIGAGLLGRVSGTVARSLERSSRRALHLLNLPAGSDIDRILTHVASLERTVRQLDHRIEDTTLAQERKNHARS